MKQGQKVIVTQAELRGRTFEGQVARTAASIDQATRTMQIEVALPNRDGTLLPGAYVNVSPADASKSRHRDLDQRRSSSVPTASSSLPWVTRGVVRIIPVKVGRNYGPTVELLDGLKGDEQLILNPPDSIAAGDKVNVAAQDGKS